MKAIMQTKYGSPDVLFLADIEKPIPKGNEVLIKVQAAAVNPLDWHFLRGTPRLMRLQSGLFKPKHKIIGADVAGVVEAVGENVTQFKPGDEVFGEKTTGGYAEYVCIKENKLMNKPANSTIEEAATLPIAAITALQSLRDNGKLLPGQKVLINGASGGVGTFAVQIAKSFGAEVTGVCSSKNLELVRSIGADHVIDYTKDDFTKGELKYDLIIDAVANRSFSELKRALNKNGIAVIVGYSSTLLKQVIFRGPLQSLTGKKKIGLMMAKINQKDLRILKDLIEKGKIKPVIDRYYPLSETADAIRYIEKGHAKGKIVIKM